MKTRTRHFLGLQDLTADELRTLLDRAIELKKQRGLGQPFEPLPGRVLAMLFDKASTRTRVSFETAMAHCGGHALFLSSNDSQIGRGESIADSARVISSMVDVLVIRTFKHSDLEQYALHSSVPVINALTDLDHPCQLLADLQTWQENSGDVAGKTAAWVGDGNNVCYSWMNAARMLGFHLNIAAPEGFGPPRDHLRACSNWVTLTQDPVQAVANADLVVTDVWSSMGQEEEQARRKLAFAGYQVNAALMNQAAPHALFMHCLPAHRGEEVSAEVIDGPRSVVWQEAENRLHSQKALLEFLLLG